MQSSIDGFNDCHVYLFKSLKNRICICLNIKFTEVEFDTQNFSKHPKNIFYPAKKWKIGLHATLHKIYIFAMIN